MTLDQAQNTLWALRDASTGNSAFRLALLDGEWGVEALTSIGWVLLTDTVIDVMLSEEDED